MTSAALNSRHHQPWPYNPLVALIREHSADIIAETITAYETENDFKATAFDLVIQTMIVACSYKPEEIWLSAGDDVAVVSELVEKDAVDMALEVLAAGIDGGTISLNKKLVAVIAADQLGKLHQLHELYKKDVNLPAYGDRALSAFGPDAELYKFQLTGESDGDEMCEAAAIEKISKTKVVFKPVDLKLSRAYIETFHYLHTVRDDDTLAFGAFVEGEEMPYAIVTYAPVGRKYKQDMLTAAGVGLDSTIELTRAWNCEYAPKNTMSLLYAYAHANIQQLFLRDGVESVTVITAVNPNLGFKGSAFRAVGFGLIGHKPTSFHYLVDPLGKHTFVTRRNLSNILNRVSGKTLHISAQFPLLPTKELAVHLNGTKRLPHVGDIYAVGVDEYYGAAPLISQTS